MHCREFVISLQILTRFETVGAENNPELDVCKPEVPTPTAFQDGGENR